MDILDKGNIDCKGSFPFAIIGPDIRLAHCWAHARRKLVEITRTGAAPIAEEGVKRIGELYQIEADLRACSGNAPGCATGATKAAHSRHGNLAHLSPCPRRCQIALGEALKYIAKY